MIIHADLDAFFASVEQKLNPALRNKPVIVTNTDPQGRSCYKGIVSTCSYEARKLGVHSGMSVWQARQLCSQGIYVKGHFEEYEKHSDAFFAILNRFSPSVEPISLDEGFLDLRGGELLYPDFTALAREIKNTIREEIGLTCSLGLAATRVVAKIASDFGKPDGLTVVPMGEEKEFLAPLPLGDLPGVGPQTEPALKKLLNRKNPTIGDFAHQPEEWVRQNLGQGGLNLWQAANDQDSVWFQARNKPQQSLNRSITFPYASQNPSYLLAQLRYLCEKVSSELFQNGLAASCVSVHTRTQQFINHSVQQTCQPIWHPGELFPLAQKLFFRLWHPSTLLRLVGMGVSHLAPRNSTLFEQKEERKIRLSQSLVKTRSKYGFESLLPASNLYLQGYT